jgi:ribonuclease R
MPISSKRILSYIHSTSKPFSAHSIAHDILSPKKKKRGKRRGGDKRDLSHINSTLSALHSIGYIRKHRKSYTKTPHFKIEGVIRLNASGNGIIETMDGAKIIITRDNTQHSHNNDLVQSELIDYRDGFFYGRIIKIIRREKERYMARIERKTSRLIAMRIIDMPGGIEVFSKRGDYPDNEISTGDLAIINITNSSPSSRQECKIEKCFPVTSEEYDLERIEIKHSLPGPHGKYRELQQIEKKIDINADDNRKDYRNLYTVTIDGEDAKDFDDAITLNTIKKGYELFVHIADVSHFVEKNSLLDREALKRGTSYYLGNSVIPMLPEILSNDLCSLKEGMDRLTLTVKISFDKNGNLIDADFSRALINVNKRLTYEIANEIIVKGGSTRLSNALGEMYRLASLLKIKRLSQGRVDLNLPEEEIVYRGNKVADIRLAARYYSHTIIEEFMLSANEVVSRTLKEQEIPSLYRIHEDISDEKLVSLKRFLRSLGLKLAKLKTTGSALQEIIDRVSGREYEQVVNFIILKSMMQAYYGEKPLGHFGLGFSDYTHFTSPIRRYPDLIVHRCLKTYIDKKPHEYREEELSGIGKRASEMERVAQRAERDLIKIKSCRLMQERIGDTFDAVVSGIAQIGFYVTLIDKPIEGMVPLRLLTDDYYLIREDDYAIIGKRRGMRYRIGDRIKVKLVNVEIENMIIDFEPQ